MRQSVSAVLPAYNEETLIGATARAVSEVLARLTDDYEVIVVNDGSRDRTQAEIDAAAQLDPHIRSINHPVNRGYGEALRTGFNGAKKDLIFLTDGDKQFDVAEIEGFLPLAQRAELVIGYRKPRMDPPVRLAYAFAWKLLVSLLFGYTARDIDCAFKLFERKVWQRVRVHSGGATFSAELLIKARRCGYRVIEAPVTHYPRTAGRATGGNPRVILRAFRDLLWLRLHIEPCPRES